MGPNCSSDTGGKIFEIHRTSFQNEKSELDRKPKHPDMSTPGMHYRPIMSVGLVCLASLFLTSVHSGTESRMPVSHKDGSNTGTFDLFLPGSQLHQERDSPAEIIVIERQGSTCGASDHESPCDVIQVLSGSFDEFLTIDEPGEMVIGIPGPDGERVVMISPGRIVTRITHANTRKDGEITEICLEHYTEKGFRLCPEPDYQDTASRPQFTIARYVHSGGVVQYVCELPNESPLKDMILIYQDHFTQQ